jgi:hypothetical protein
MRERFIPTVLILSAAGVLILLGSAAGAMQLTGSVEGIIKDATGGVLPGATVELRNEQSGATLSRTSGSAGEYSFAAVKPGMYRISASFKGFTPASRNVEVEINKTSRVDFTLAISPLAMQVVVSGASQARDLNHSELSLAADSLIFDEETAFSRDITQLA